jgi:hypothetical protein
VPIGMILFVLDIVLVVHAAKTGRFSPWGYLIIVLPGIGAFIYVVAELLPGRRYRQLTEELAIVDTIANRAALAGECLTLGKFEEALAHYEMIIAQPLGEEPHFFLGKARAQCALGQPAGAVATLDDLMRRWPNFHSFDGHLLYAIALEESGRADEALAHYAKVGQYYPGAEPRVRQAQLLRKLGRNADAKALAEDIVRGLSRAPSHVRRNQREWLANAQRLARG